MHARIIPFAQLAATLAPHRERGETIVQCHGTFDLVHPGHIVHLEEAKAHGKILVVTVTGEAFVSKGPGRPVFNDTLRARALAALAVVDYVAIVPDPGARAAILAVRPDIYCKGEEYRDPATRPTGSMDEDLPAVAEVGARMEFLGSFVLSSTRLLNTALSPHDDRVRAFCEALARVHPPAAFAQAVEDCAALRVLVVGDIIFDRYTTVAIQGLTSKTPVMSTRFMHEDLHGGGTLAVFRHLRDFCPDLTLCGLIGDEPWADAALRRDVDADRDAVIRAPGRATIVKQRFTDAHAPGFEVRPLFAVETLDPAPPAPDLHAALVARLAPLVAQADLVIAMDFGHGVMGDPVRDLLQSKARFLAVNCQTNSSNFGFNVLNRRYRRADSFSLDHTELQLAAGIRHQDNREDLDHLRRTLNARYAWLTRGPVETLGLSSSSSSSSSSPRPLRSPREASGSPSADSQSCLVPPFERRVVDAIGAGDAFCALASLAAARGLPLPLATFMGQLAGAMAVRWVGNAEAIRKPAYLRGGQAMLRF